MNILELKIPPVAFSLICAVCMLLTSALLPQYEILGGPGSAAAMGLAVVGGVIAVLGVWEFRKANTTVNPMTPGASSALVTSGVYKITRNPMYLGLLLALIGFGLYLQSFYSLGLCVVFVLYINRFQIAPEERVLESCFGEEFAAYKRRVRRWI